MRSFRVSSHARIEATRRGISQEVLESVVQHPQQVVPAWGGRVIHQSRIKSEGRQFLIRAVVAETAEESIVVTVYRTGKIDKYWRVQ